MNLFSLEFILLLTITLILYYIVPKKYQWVCLLVSSICFYVYSSVINICYIVFTSLTIWCAGLFFEKIDTEFKNRKKDLSKEERKLLKDKLQKKKRKVLYLVLILNFGILSYLKYWEVIYESILNALHGTNVNYSLGLLLPLGISFYTFQSVGYLMDRYNGACKGEQNYLKFLLFVSYFPQIIQGPINRYTHMREQFEKTHEFQWEQMKRGLFLLLFGLMKKYAIANLLSGAIAAILDAPQADIPGSVVVIGILMYSAQQYADFSGGIDMVLGISLMFGIEMMPNFRQPYFAVSLADFWRRWHISLGAWMRDYVFYPFALTKPMQNLGKWGMNRLGRTIGRVLPACLGNILVFFIVGLWHGAQLHYILWGLYNGVIIAMSELLAPLYDKMIAFLHINTKTRKYYVFTVVRTFIIVNIGWYFDRIVDIGDCLLCFKNTVVQFDIFRAITYITPLMDGILSLKMIPLILVAVCLVICSSVMAEKNRDVFTWISQKNIVIRWSIYYLMLILIQISMVCTNATETFMYALF